jgi:enhancing lycopene biosynthesis protein 2
MKKIAVLLAGCGSLDGTEIHEAVITLLSIKQYNADYQCFSIDDNQNQVTDHVLKQQSVDQVRNMMTESARIARGEINLLSQLVAQEYDGLIIPGGYGVAYNFCDFAIKGKDFTVRRDIVDICQTFTKLAKPVGFICISPIMITKIYQDLCNQAGKKIKLTLGQDQQLADLVNESGMQHVNTKVDEVCVDENYKIVSTAAYMLAQNILEVYSGINKLVKEILFLS